MDDDAFRLQRFVDAQNWNDVHLDAVHELRSGLKQGHWMWFVFPQLVGLGYSRMATTYGITGLPEAAAYLAHPVLGPRLIECARILTELPGNDAVEIFGATDAQKLHSSMTLFALAATHGQVFRDVLDKYFGGEHDPGTTSKL